MRIESEDVRVIGITHAISAIDARSLYQVAFGKFGTPAAVPPGVPPNATAAVVLAVVFIPADQPCPYAIGSRWKLSVESDGSITLLPPDEAPLAKRPARAATRSG